MSRDRDCYSLTKISEILGGAKDLACPKDLTILSVAGRYNKPVQYGRESIHKSRAQGNHSSLGVYMYTIQHISEEENETISWA